LIAISARQQDILRNLTSSINPLEIDFFVKKYGRSERTIRYDVHGLRSYLKEYGIQIKISINNGIYIPVSQKNDALYRILALKKVDYSFENFENEETRIQNLFFLLLYQKAPINADKLANLMYVSKSTVVRNLQEIGSPGNDSIKVLFSKSKGIRLSGNEFEIRLKATEILKKTLQGTYNEDDWFQLLPSTLKSQISREDIQNFSNTIKKQNLAFDVWISHDVFLTLLSYIIIRAIRMKNIEKFEWSIQARNTHDLNGELSYILETIKGIDDLENYDDYYEIQSFMRLLKKYKVTIRGVNSGLNPKLDLTIKTMLAELNNITSMKFDQLTLYKDLFQHLRHYLRIQDEGVSNEINPVLDRVKNEYFEFYKFSTIISMKFKENFGFELPEIEILFVTIYLYKNVLNVDDVKKMILVVCATGKGLSNLLTTRIKRVFPDLIVIGSVSAYQIENYNFKNKIDFIISTVPIASDKFIVIKVSPILGLDDIQRIQEHLLGIDSTHFNLTGRVNELSMNGLKSPKVSPQKFELPSSNDFANYSAVIINLVISLLESISKFPQEYRLDHDEILGLTIHLVLAIPRWYVVSNSENEVEERYANISEKHPKIFDIMDRFFKVIENNLHVTISISERYAFHLYIIKEEQI